VEDVLQFMVIEAVEDGTVIIVRILFTEASLILLSRMCAVDEDIIEDVEKAILEDDEARKNLTEEDKDDIICLAELTGIISNFIKQYICSDANAIAIRPTSNEYGNEFEAIISIKKES